jgi:hypothetical protein
LTLSDGRCRKVSAFSYALCSIARENTPVISRERTRLRKLEEQDAESDDFDSEMPGTLSICHSGGSLKPVFLQKNLSPFG